MDIDEFEEFFDEMHPRLLRYALRSVDAEMAAEATVQALQTIWLKDLPGAKSAADGRQLRGLAYRVIDGHIRNLIRSQQRRARLIRAVTEHQLTRSNLEPDVADLVIPDDGGARDALSTLGPDEREVLSMRMDGYTVAEIAALTGRSPGAVSMRLGRARKTMKQLLAKARPGRYST